MRVAGYGMRVSNDIIREAMKSYRDLAVYKLAHELGLSCHKLSMKLPKHELYETGSQFLKVNFGKGCRRIRPQALQG